MGIGSVLSRRGPRIVRMSLFTCTRWIVLALGILSFLLPTTPPAAAEEKPSPPAAAANPPSKIRSGDDGWLDVSGFLDESYGFIPLVIPITEPNEKLGIKRSAH